MMNLKTKKMRRTMMKKTLIDGLKGQAVKEAVKQVKDAGLDVEVLPKGAFRMAMIVANTLFLYQDGDTVCSVEPGDPTEVE
jgi:hypothetical protein